MVVRIIIEPVVLQRQTRFAKIVFGGTGTVWIASDAEKIL
jgi:hypothetical protein